MIHLSFTTILFFLGEDLFLDSLDMVADGLEAVREKKNIRGTLARHFLITIFKVNH